MANPLLFRRDTIPEAFTTLLSASSIGTISIIVVQFCFLFTEYLAGHISSLYVQPAAPSEAEATTGPARGRRGPGAGGGARTPTVGAQFKAQLLNLVLLWFV